MYGYNSNGYILAALCVTLYVCRNPIKRDRKCMINELVRREAMCLRVLAPTISDACGKMTAPAKIATQQEMHRGVTVKAYDLLITFQFV